MEEEKKDKLKFFFDYLNSIKKIGFKEGLKYSVLIILLILGVLITFSALKYLFFLTTSISFNYYYDDSLDSYPLYSDTQEYNIYAITIECDNKDELVNKIKNRYNITYLNVGDYVTYIVIKVEKEKVDEILELLENYQIKKMVVKEDDDYDNYKYDNYKDKYILFQIKIVENKIIDFGTLKKIWKDSLKQLIKDINDTLINLSIGLIDLVVKLIQYILYIYIIVIFILFSLRILFKTARKILNI